jgi:hypothetical protein
MCGCSGHTNFEPIERTYSQEVSNIINKWILDDLGRRLLIQTPIHDVYNDIIGYITKNEEGNVIRIFSRSIMQVLD